MHWQRLAQCDTNIDAVRVVWTVVNGLYICQVKKERILKAIIGAIVCCRVCSTMRSFVSYVFFLVLLSKTCYSDVSSTTSSKDSLDNAQKSNIRRVISEMIGVNVGDVERRSGRWSSVDQPVFTGRSRLPPRYIYRLYERYRSGYIVHGADTVRSVNAELGSSTPD